MRLGHGIIIFPGGVGTAEELLYILGVLMNPANQHQPLPVVLTGPKSSAAYFQSLDKFVRATLGDAAARHYEIIIGDTEAVGQLMKTSMPHVRDFRKAIGDAYSYNWALHIEPDFQLPFEPTHENMAKLNLLTGAAAGATGLQPAPGFLRYRSRKCEGKNQSHRTGYIPAVRG